MLRNLQNGPSDAALHPRFDYLEVEFLASGNMLHCQCVEHSCPKDLVNRCRNVMHLSAPDKTSENLQ